MRVRAIRDSTLSLSLACALLAAGCGAASTTTAGGGPSRTIHVPVGQGRTVTVRPGPAKIALFLPGSGNNWLQSAIDQAKKEATAANVKITIFADSNFDPSVEFNEIQNAIQSRQYYGLIVLWPGGNQTCTMLPQTAPSQGIIVSTIDLPICGLFDKEGAAQAPAGVLNYIGGTYTVTGLEQWLEKLAVLNPGPHKVGFFYGPAVNPLTLNMQQALKEFLPRHPAWTVVGSKNTDFTINQGFSLAQNLLQAHSDVSLILSAYSDVTIGILRALKSSGRLGHVKVAELGGEKGAVPLIESGQLEMTVAQYPRHEITAAIRSIVGAVQHEIAGPRYIPNAGHALQPDQPASQDLYFVTKQNVRTFHPDY